MRDVGLLVWLRWRHLRGRFVYWASIGGADLEDGSLTNRLYAFYLTLIVLGWMWLSASAAIDIAYDAGSALGTAAPSIAFQALEALPLSLFAGLAAQALRSSPIKFTFAEMGYVAATPLRRSAIGIIECTSRILGIAALTAVLTFFAAVAFGGAPSSPASVSPAVRAALAGALAASGATALAWALGLARMRVRRGRPWPWGMWLLPLGLPLLAFLTSAVYWPGSALTAALRGSSAAAPLLFLGAVAVLGMMLVYRFASRLDVVRVTNDSTLYAQLQVYRPLRLYDPAALRDITRRKKLATKRPRGHLPAGSGAHAPLARALVSHLRQPASLLGALLWGGLIAPAGAAMLLAPRSLFAYLPWVLIVLISPASGLVQVFAQDVERPSLRELLPFDSLTLLALDSAPVLAVMTAASVLATMLQRLPLSTGLLVLLLDLLLDAVFVLCRGLELTPLPGRQHSLGYPVTIIVTAVIVLATGASTGLGGACVAAASCVAVLGALLRQT